MSPSLPEQLRRPTLRYAGYDYAASGAYFVTICAFRGLPLFGHIEQQTIIANPIGNLVLDCWRQIPDHHDGVVLDEAMLMPNHFHGVLWQKQDPEEAAAAAITLDPSQQAHHDPVERHFSQPQAGTLSTIIGSFKAAVTREARRLYLTPQRVPLWHRGFWDRIIRNEQELATIRDYVRNNPMRWPEDQPYYGAAPNQFNRELWEEDRAP